MRSPSPAGADPTRGRRSEHLPPADGPGADDVDLGFLARQFELAGGTRRSERKKPVRKKKGGSGSTT